MQRVQPRVALFAVVACFLDFYAPRALAQQTIVPAMGVSDARRYVVLSTAMEAALATASLMKDRTPEAITKAEWSAQFSDRIWALDFKDERSSYRLTGYLWGTDNADWVVTFAGSGSIVGKEPVYVNGKAEWLYDPKSADYPTMNFHNVVKFGDHSAWGWLVASEIIVGGAFGVLTGITFTVGTGGVGTGPAIFAGVKAGVLATGVLIAVSAEAKSMTEKWVEAPRLPERPTVPRQDEKFEPGKDKIAVGVTAGEVIGYSGDGSLFLSGSVRGDVGTGILIRR
jgi:hypothetical protein